MRFILTSYGLVIASKVIHVHIFRIFEYVISCGKKDFEDMIILQIWG